MERILDPPLDEMVAAHLRGCWARDRGDSLEAYKCQSMVVTSFAKLLGECPVHYDSEEPDDECFRITEG